MRRIVSLPGLAAAVWLTSLAFLGLLAGMMIVFAWHPHFLPVTIVLSLVIATGFALIIVAPWRVIRGPDRRRALACLLIGAAPLWFLAGFFLYGVALGTGRMEPHTLSLRLLAPLGESLMDLEARLRYPQRTYGEKVVMISPPMPEAQARAGGCDGPPYPRPGGEAGAANHGNRALGARTVAGQGRRGDHRPVPRQSTGRGIAGCRGPFQPRPPRSRTLRAHQPLQNLDGPALLADRRLGQCQPGRRRGHGGRPPP